MNPEGSILLCDLAHLREIIIAETNSCLKNVFPTC